MILQNSLTGLVNGLSVSMLFITTSSPVSFLGTLFILASSIFLEAFSLIDDVRRSHSKIVGSCMVVLFVASIAGWIFSTLGLMELVNIYFLEEDPVRVMLASFNYSIFHILPIDVSDYIVFSGIMTIVIPLLLAARAAIIKWFRKSKYHLEQGFCGK